MSKTNEEIKQELLDSLTDESLTDEGISRVKEKLSVLTQFS